MPAGRLNESEVVLDAAVVVIVALGYKISLPSAGHKFAAAEAFCAMNESDIVSKSKAFLSKASFSVPPNVLGTALVEVHFPAVFKLPKRLLKRFASRCVPLVLISPPIVASINHPVWNLEL
jgi:hypothetical protein